MEEMVRRSDACWTTGGGRGSGDEATVVGVAWKYDPWRDCLARGEWRRCRFQRQQGEVEVAAWVWWLSPAVVPRGDETMCLAGRRERLVVEVSRWGEDIGIGADYGLWRRLRLMAPNPRGGAWQWKGVEKRKNKKKKKEEDEELAVACLILSPDICFKICAVRKEKQGLVKIIFYIIKNIKYN